MTVIDIWCLLTSDVSIWNLVSLDLICPYTTSETTRYNQLRHPNIPNDQIWDPVCPFRTGFSSSKKWLKNGLKMRPNLSPNELYSTLICPHIQYHTCSKYDPKMSSRNDPKWSKSKIPEFQILQNWRNPEIWKSQILEITSSHIYMHRHAYRSRLIQFLW